MGRPLKWLCVTGRWQVTELSALPLSFCLNTLSTFTCLRDIYHVAERIDLTNSILVLKSARMLVRCVPSCFVLRSACGVCAFGGSLLLL